MNIKEDIKPISYIKANAAEILKQVNNTHRPVYVTQNGEARAVLLDTESYEKMQKTIGLFKIISQGEKDIKDGNIMKNDEFFNNIEKKLNRIEQIDD